MSSKISKFKNYIKSNFPTDWIDEYLGDNKEISSEKKQKLNNFISDSINELVTCFYKSLLSGEYINNTRKLIKEINNLSTITDSRLGFLIDNPVTQEVLKESIKEGFNDVLKVYSKLYINFIKLIEVYNNNPNLDILFESDQNFNNLYNKINKDNKDNIKLFDLTILVFKIDHFFNDNDSTYKLLLQLDNSINEFSRIKYNVSIKEKLHFLKFKWEVRQKSYKRNGSSSIKAYLIDNELLISTDEINFSSGSEKIQEWKKYIECYYELDDWKNNLSKNIANFKHKKINTFTILELLQLLKYYKDINTNYKNLTDVVNQLENKFIKNQNKEKRFIFNKVFLYALNNQFSLLLENSTDDDEISKLKIKIEKTQSKCNIDNFFIDSKYINYRLDLLQLKYEKREEFDELLNEKEEIDNLQKAIKSYKNKLRWSKNNYNLLYQLPRKESLVPSNIDDLSIYYASSVVLPLPHKVSEENFEKINDKFKRLKQLSLSVSNLSKEFNSIKELQNNKLRTMEYIGVFTAVTAFIITSIPSFAFVKNFYQALLFTSIIGSSLLLMVSLIFLFTRGFKKLESWGVIIAVFSLLTFSIYTLKSTIKKNNDVIKKEEIEKIIKSLKINSIKVDSIKKPALKKG